MWALMIGLGALLAALPARAETIRIEGGSYEVLAPEGWNGRAALEFLVFFHGYRANGASIMGNAAIVELADRHGRLLVAPNGRADARGVTSWSHQGSPAQNRDELAFIDAVLADVCARFPIVDEPPVFAGFSQGASMVWDLACQRGGTFGSYVAIGGGFWEPMPASCTTPVGTLVHVHGLDDSIVPLEGRAIAGRWHQADIGQGLERFKSAAECPQPPDELEGDAALHCRTWTSCTAGKIRLCLHPAGHELRLQPLVDLLAE